jgi:hypothetical protein
METSLKHNDRKEAVCNRDFLLLFSSLRIQLTIRLLDEFYPMMEQYEKKNITYP